MVATAYELEGRELVAEAPGPRVQMLTVGPGRCMPRHRRTAISDTFFCLAGPMVPGPREPETVLRSKPGERATVLPGQPHRMTGTDGSRRRFVIVQGVGEYDYIPDA